jgi:hypothetical protein
MARAVYKVAVWQGRGEKMVTRLENAHHHLHAAHGNGERSPFSDIHKTLSSRPEPANAQQPLARTAEHASENEVASASSSTSDGACGRLAGDAALAALGLGIIVVGEALPMFTGGGLGTVYVGGGLAILSIGDGIQQAKDCFG